MTIRQAVPATPEQVARARALVERLGVGSQVEAAFASRGVDYEMVIGSRRGSSIARARHWLMWVIRDLTGMSYPLIGAYLNRDHASVLDGVRKARAAQPLFAPLPRSVPADEQRAAQAIVDGPGERARIVALLHRQADELHARGMVVESAAVEKAAAMVRRREDEHDERLEVDPGVGRGDEGGVPPERAGETVP